MSAPVREGDVLAGKFRVERVLGIGGMGVVVAARHLAFDELVALKFLLPEALAQPEVITRFAREAQAAFKIKSEHVCRVTDVGELPTGAPYMVMEYLEGSDLASVLTSRGAVPIAEAVEYVLQALEAVSEAHSLGIVHRDLKPANLFLAKRADGSPLVKVIDFGISKLTVGAGAGMTKTSTVMGSPGYMAPEQWAKTAETRSDIWAIGVILYELIAGVPPFEGDSLPALWTKIAQEPPTSLRALRPETPEGLEQVVLKCLEKQPADRYDTVAGLAVALAKFAPKHARVSVERVSRIVSGSAAAIVPTQPPPPPSEPAPAVTAAGAAPAPPPAATGTQTVWGQTRGGAKKATKPAIALAALLLAGVGLTFFLRGRSQPAAPAAAPPASAVEVASATQPPPPVVAVPPASSVVVPAVAASTRAKGGTKPAAEKPAADKPPVDKPAPDKPSADKAAPAAKPTPAPATTYNPRDHL